MEISSKFEPCFLNRKIKKFLFGSLRAEEGGGKSLTAKIR